MREASHRSVIGRLPSRPCWPSRIAVATKPASGCSAANCWWFRGQRAFPMAMDGFFVSGERSLLTLQAQSVSVRRRHWLPLPQNSDVSENQGEGLGLPLNNAVPAAFLLSLSLLSSLSFSSLFFLCPFPFSLFFLSFFSLFSFFFPFFAGRRFECWWQRRTGRTQYPDSDSSLHRPNGALEIPKYRCLPVPGMRDP